LAAGGVHPVQLYEAALNLGLFGFLARRCPRKAFEGEVAALYVTIYAGLRFLVEFFRGDYGVKHLGDWATSGQLMSLGLLAFGVWLYRLLGRRALRDRPSRA
jgi:phosphatidylglycerol:prolipoprotein diacylglycerol transferase